MKLDDELRLVILEKVGIYSKRFSTSEPQVFFTNKEVMAAQKKLLKVVELRPTSIMVYPTWKKIQFSSM